MFHQFIHILNFISAIIKLFNKILNVLFFKIQLSHIILWNNIFLKKIFPNILVLKYQTFCHYYVSIIVKYNLKSKQISIKINRFFYIRNHNKYISKFHFFIFLSLNLLSL